MADGRGNAHTRNSRLHDGCHDRVWILREGGFHAGACRRGEVGRGAGADQGNVSLALGGKGEGWNLGVAFGALVIE
jgi:hypothetical protein